MSLGFRGVLTGTVTGDPNVRVFGEGKKQVYVKIRVQRYDMKDRKRVNDSYRVIVGGNLATKAENVLDGDEVAVVCEAVPTEAGPVYLAKEFSLLGEEGLNYHVVIGAIERQNTRVVSSGDSVTNANIRIPRRWTDRDGEEHESGSWLRATLWRNLSNMMDKYMQPTPDGVRWVELCGKTTVKSWTDGSGEKRYSTELDVDNIGFLNTKTQQWANEIAGEEIGGSTDEYMGDSDPYDDEDVPF